MTESGAFTVDIHGGQPILRASLRLLLKRESDCTVPPHEASDLAAESPAVVLLCLPSQELATEEWVASTIARGSRVLIIGSAEDADTGLALMLAGASGFADQNRTGIRELVSALKQVARGQAAIHPAVAAMVLQQWRQFRQSTADSAGERALTEQEGNVLKLMVEGRNASTIARSLGLSVRTVHSYRARIYVKLAVRTEAQAVATALDRQLVWVTP